MKGKYDILWKGMLERVFDDFLRFVFPDADRRFDMKKGFTYLDKEMERLYQQPDGGTDTRFLDKLVKVYMIDGKQKYLLVHVEVQGSYDKTFTARMFRYFYRVYDKYDGQPILPVAIFTGEGGKWMGNRFHLEDDGMQLTYQFKTLDIKDFTEEELKASDNPFAGVLLAAKGIFDFIYNYVLFDKPEYNLIFKEQIDEITGKPNTMDIIEQVAEIRVEEAQEKAVNAFLSNTEFSVEKIAQLLDVPVSFVKKVKENLQPKLQGK
jgi:hypothetical protein